MGKISNKTIYPKQDPVSDLDYMVGTSASTLVTKSFTIGDIVNLGFAENTITKTSNYTLSLSDKIIYLNSSSPFVVTLPTATNGKSFELKNIGFARVKVVPASGQEIDGESQFFIYTDEAFDIKSNGSNWYIF